MSFKEHLLTGAPACEVELSFKGYFLTGAPACEVQRVLPGVRSEGDVLLGARKENPGEGLQEKSPQVSPRQGEF